MKSHKVESIESKSGELIVEVIKKESGKKIPVVTLNRPKALNSLTLVQVREMVPLYRNWMNDSDVEMIILGSQGDRAFCAGGDIRDLYESGKDGTPGLINRQFTYEEYQLNYLIKTMNKPHVAMINGITMGGIKKKFFCFFVFFLFYFNFLFCFLGGVKFLKF